MTKNAKRVRLTDDAIDDLRRLHRKDPRIVRDPRYPRRNRVVQHSSPKTAAVGVKSGLCAAQPGGTGIHRPYRGGIND